MLTEYGAERNEFLTRELLPNRFGYARIFRTVGENELGPLVWIRRIVVEGNVPSLNAQVR